MHEHDVGYYLQAASLSTEYFPYIYLNAPQVSYVHFDDGCTLSSINGRAHRQGQRFS